MFQRKSDFNCKLLDKQYYGTRRWKIVIENEAVFFCTCFFSDFIYEMLVYLSS